jgi:hypothetical protein
VLITDLHSHPHFSVNKFDYLLCNYDISILSTLAGIAPCTTHICARTHPPRAPARLHPHARTHLPTRTHTPARTCPPAPTRLHAPTRPRAPARTHPHACTHLPTRTHTPARTCPHAPPHAHTHLLAHTHTPAPARRDNARRRTLENNVNNAAQLRN